MKYEKPISGQFKFVAIIVNVLLVTSQQLLLYFIQMAFYSFSDAKKSTHVTQCFFIQCSIKRASLMKMLLSSINLKVCICFTLAIITLLHSAMKWIMQTLHVSLISFFFNQNEGKQFVSLDAIFGLKRWQKSGRSDNPPRHRDTFFISQSQVDEFLASYDGSSSAASTVCSLNCTPRTRLNFTYPIVMNSVCAVKV